MHGSLEVHASKMQCILGVAYAANGLPVRNQQGVENCGVENCGCRPAMSQGSRGCDPEQRTVVSQGSRGCEPKHRTTPACHTVRG